MQRILRLVLALAVVTAAVAYTSGATFACDSRSHHQLKLDSLGNVVEVQKPEVVNNESTVRICTSPPLLEKPRKSVYPIMMAMGIVGGAIMVLLRRRRASMLVMGASLVGLFAAIGFCWYEL